MNDDGGGVGSSGGGGDGGGGGGDGGGDGSLGAEERLLSSGRRRARVKAESHLLTDYSPPSRIPDPVTTSISSLPIVIPKGKASIS